MKVTCEFMNRNNVNSTQGLVRTCSLSDSVVVIVDYFLKNNKNSMDSSSVKSKMNPSRKRKRISTENEPTVKRIKTEVSYKTKKRKGPVESKNSSVLAANMREIRIILDKSIVDKYFYIKQMLRDILSPSPVNVHLKNDKKSKKSKKQSSLLDYLQVNNDSFDCSSFMAPSYSIMDLNDTMICENVSIKQEPLEMTPVVTADIDQNNTATFEPQILYYTGYNQSKCFLYNGNLMVMPVNNQFTPEEYIYNNCGFVPVMGVPMIKTEFDEESIVKEELDMINSSLTIHEHTISDTMSIGEITTTSTPVVKTTFKEDIIKSCHSNKETKQTTIKFDKRGYPICPKCDRSFKKLDFFKQHKLLCGLEFLYECSYCAYATKFTHALKKHVERSHKKEVEDEGLENILKIIRKKRMDKKNLSLVSKETEDLSLEAEESVMKSIKNVKYNHSKLKFDLFCPKCKKSFKRVQGIPIKVCPDCKVTVEFKCQICEQLFSQYNKVYKHVSRCGINGTKISNKVALNCEHCDFKAYYKQALRQHIFSKHMKNDKSSFFKCEMCSFKTLYEHNLKRHTGTVHEVNETIGVGD